MSMASPIPVLQTDIFLIQAEYNHSMSAFLRFHDLTKSYYEGDVRRVVLQNATPNSSPARSQRFWARAAAAKAPCSI